MTRIVAHIIVVVAIDAVLVQEDVLYLAAHVVSHLVNIKLNESSGLLGAEATLLSIGHFAANV
jgi:hypothetical protein